jgi:hypothetical protein
MPDMLFLAWISFDFLGCTSISTKNRVLIRIG